MRNWKLWTFAGASALVALLAILWRFYSPLDRAYLRYVSDRSEEAISLLESDPTAYQTRTQNMVRLVAAATANGSIATPEALYTLAIQHEREGDFDAAEMVYRQVIAKVAGWSWPYVALGTLLARFGGERLVEAEQLLRTAVELQPDWVRPYNSLSVVLRLLGYLEASETVVLQALELDPDDVAAHNNYANLLVVMERFEEAESHYRFAMENEPENAKPPYNLACLYSIIGAYEDACDYLEMAISLNESSIADAAIDPYFDPMRGYPRFQTLVYGAVMPYEGENMTEAGEGILSEGESVSGVTIPVEGAFVPASGERDKGQ